MKTVAFLFTALVLLSCGGSDYDQELEDELMNNENPRDLAEACAQTEIKELLKSPTTAEFNTRATVTEWNDSTFAVSGTVDSQNGYGAMVRSYYQCKITFHNNMDTYTISDIDIR